MHDRWEKKNCNVSFLTQPLIKIDLGFKILVPPFQFLYLQLYLDLPVIHLAPTPQNLAPAVPRLAPNFFHLAKEMATTFLEPERTLKPIP